MYCVPETKCTLSQVILKTILWANYYCYHYFINKNIEAQKVLVTS